MYLSRRRRLLPPLRDMTMGSPLPSGRRHTTNRHRTKTCVSISGLFSMLRFLKFIINFLFTVQKYPKNKYTLKQLKDGFTISLSYFKDNIYFWNFLVWQKCSRNPKMDKKNVQFLKT
jgi:hypothetical protein